MPTPFLHLPIAYEVAQLLRPNHRLHLPSFLLGSTIPDIAQVEGRPRSETHFWTTENDVSGALKLLAAHPQLEAGQLGEQERAYVAGYLCHLVADEQWTFCIWRPYFGLRTQFGGSAEGAALQGAFRDVLDAREWDTPPGRPALAREVQDALPIDQRLPPFVPLDEVERFRRLLAERLRKPHEWPETPLHQQGVAYVKPESVAAFRERARGESVTLLQDYLSGRPLRPPRDTEDLEAPDGPGATSRT